MSECHRLGALAFALSLLGTGCENSTQPTTSPPTQSTTLQITAGNGQSATVGTALPVKPTVRLVGSGANPIAGVTVTFSVTAGGGSATGATVTTDGDGVAAVGSWTLGTVAGANTMVATATGSGIAGNPASFSATGNADSPKTLMIVAGADQTGYAGNPVRVPPSVKVVDQYDNPNAGVGVTFAVALGGGTVGGGNQTTGPNGIATVSSWTMGPAGANRLTATAAGDGISGNPQDINATAVEIAALGAGGEHTCAIAEPLGLHCWGRNVEGQLGDATNLDRAQPAAVGTVRAVWLAVTGGATHTCALASTQSVWCWGGNAFGQLADGTTANQNRPFLGHGPTTLMTAGDSHTCWFFAPVWRQCAGRNAEGQLGNGSMVSPAGIVSIEDPFAPVRMAGGAKHTCEIAATRAVYCWGLNDRGQLGDGTTTSRPAPVAAGGGSYFELSAGAKHTCAIGGDAGAVSGPVYCWGAGANGRLGDGLTADRATPQAVLGGVLYRQVAAGSEHTCALTPDGSVACWGGNGFGQLGLGDGVDRSTPTALTGPLVFQAIVAGGYHTCGLTVSGRIFCWGRNDRGQLGDGTTVSRNAAVEVVF